MALETQVKILWKPVKTRNLKLEEHYRVIERRRHHPTVIEVNGRTYISLAEAKRRTGYTGYKLIGAIELLGGNSRNHRYQLKRGAPNFFLLDIVSQILSYNNPAEK